MLPCCTATGWNNPRDRFLISPDNGLMIDAQLLADHFDVSLRAARLQTDGLTHADSLMQLPFRGNCMNWTLGHMLLCREEIIEWLGGARVFPHDALARYDNGSEPITRDEAGVIPLEALLDMFAQNAPRLRETLLATTPETWAKEVKVGQNTRTLARRVFFYFFHEATHVGELGLLRQLTGKNAKVI